MEPHGRQDEQHGVQHGHPRAHRICRCRRIGSAEERVVHTEGVGAGKPPRAPFDVLLASSRALRDLREVHLEEEAPAVDPVLRVRFETAEAEGLGFEGHAGGGPGGVVEAVKDPDVARAGVVHEHLHHGGTQGREDVREGRHVFQLQRYAAFVQCTYWDTWAVRVGGRVA